MTRLDEILAATRERVHRAKTQVDVRALENQAGAHEPRGFRKRRSPTGLSGNRVKSLFPIEMNKAEP